MESLRQNTVKVQFQKTDAKPSDQEMIQFVLNNGLTTKDVHTLYQDLYERCIYIKFNTEQRYIEFLSETNVVTFKYTNGTTTEVSIKGASGIMRYVRMFNLPPEILDKTVSEAMHRFGNVLSTRREKFGANSLLPVFSGVRGIYIEIEKDIPQFIYIQNIKARIFYDGMKEKCYKCGEDNHKKPDCPLLHNTNKNIAEQQVQQQALQHKEPKEQQNTQKQSENEQQNSTIEKSTVHTTTTQEHQVKYSDIAKINMQQIETQNKIGNIKQMINLKEHMNKERKLETDSSCIDTESEGVSVKVNKRGRPSKKTRYTSTKHRTAFMEQYNDATINTDNDNNFITPTPPMKTGNDNANQ